MALTVNEYKRKFLASDEAIQARHQLEAMMLDVAYNTKTYYVPKQEAEMSFSDKHMAYLCQHPKLNPREYLANLRLMTKARQ